MIGKNGMKIDENAKIVDWAKKFKESVESVLGSSRLVAIDFTFLDEDNNRMEVGFSHESYDKAKYDEELEK